MMLAMPRVLHMQRMLWSMGVRLLAALMVVAMMMVTMLTVLMLVAVVAFTVVHVLWRISRDRRGRMHGLLRISSCSRHK